MLDPISLELDRIAQRAALPACVTIALIYAFLAVMQPWISPGVTPRSLIALQFATSAAALVAGLACWRRSVPPRWSRRILLALFALVALNLATYQAWSGQPEATVFHVFALAAGATTGLSRSYFAAVVAMVCLAWWWPSHSLGLFSPEMRHWTGLMGAALPGAWGIHEVRRRAILREVELRLLAEQKLIAERALQGAQRRESLGVLAGGIAHDFNNLLAAIMGNVELALDSLPDKHDVREFLCAANEASARAARITRQILSYAGRADTRKRHLALGHQAAGIGRLVASSFAMVTIHVRGSEPGPTVEADPAQLDQLLLNLVQNAAEACNERAAGGRVDIDWGEADVSDDELQTMLLGAGQSAGRFAFAEVSDDGCGVPAEKRQMIFEPFFTTKPKGSGLGLAVVEGIARAHDAFVGVESLPGRGTRVRVFLPRVISPPITEGSEAAVGWKPSFQRVLVVDDDPAVLEVTCSLLEAEGLSTIATDRGEEALELLQTHPEIRALVVDLTMPSLDGVAVAHRADALRSDLRIVIMSGFDRDDVLARLSTGRPHAILAKPFNRIELLAALREAEERHEASASRPFRD